MSRFTRTSVRLLAAAITMVLVGQLWAFAAERARPASKPRAHPLVTAPFAIPHEFVTPEPPRPKPTPRVALKPKPAPKPRPKPTQRKQPSVFSGLGVWVDQFDFANLDVARSISIMRSNGVHTLYIQSGESSTVDAVLPEVGEWLVAAHQAGIKVVGWYLPHYSDVKLDVARTVAAARYEFAGQRFDGVGVDIEYRRAVKGHAQWNQRVAEQMALARRALGARYPLAAIPPPPLQMAVAPSYWAGFPWASLARSSSEIMIMAYWSARDDCPENPLHCAYGYTRVNVEQTRALTGGRVPIHVIGGVGSRITAQDVAAFVKGARAAHADGASLYDFATTAGSWWRALRSLRVLGT
jgi:hypothetical protein